MKNPITILILGVILMSAQSGYAANATWSSDLTNGSWADKGNWSPNHVPNGDSDGAIFDISNTTEIDIPWRPSNFTVNRIVFNSGASAYTLTVKAPAFFFITGDGVVNNSGAMQNFVAEGNIWFDNFAIVGPLTTFRALGSDTVGGGGSIVEFFSHASGGSGNFISDAGTLDGAYGADIEFYAASSMGDGSITARGSTVSGAHGGFVDFWDNSTAGASVITAEGSQIAGTGGGNIRFWDNASAGDSVITAQGSAVAQATGGTIIFFQNSSALNSTLIAESGANGGRGGVISFEQSSNGDNSRVQVFGNGRLDLSAYGGRRGTSIGSLQGDGSVFLGATELAVGGDDLSTSFAGTIADGGQNGGTGGSLSKEGNGTLLLTGTNTYTGGTVVSGGTLLVKGNDATGHGRLSVNAGTLGGSGTINGPVRVGTGGGSGALLSPGLPENPIHTIIILGALTLESDATYEVTLDSDTATADAIVSKSTTINSAIFSASDLGSALLAPSAVFAVIRNSTAAAIAGTFANLPDGGTITIGSNTFEANYEGGDGNDLTLTVVP